MRWWVLESCASISSRLHRVAVGGASLLALVGLCGCSGSSEGSDSACAAEVTYNGHPYFGYGELVREPDITGRSFPAVLPGCDDSGGQDPAELDEAVVVHELVDVDPSVAVLLNGALYIRDGRVLPKAARSWFERTACTTAGEFRLTADWFGATGPNMPGFDGDIRPDYRLEAKVTTGPARYIGSTIMVHATDRTDPSLSPADVKKSLREGGQIIATVACADRRFVASGLRTTPPT